MDGGIHLDVEANRANAQIISAKHSPTIVFIIPTNEELMIAEHTVKDGRGHRLERPDRFRGHIERKELSRFGRGITACRRSSSIVRSVGQSSFRVRDPMNRPICPPGTVLCTIISLGVPI